MVSNHGEIVGGGEISLLALLQGLDRTRWNPEVVVPSEGEVAVRCREAGLHTHVVPLPSIFKARLYFLSSIILLRRVILKTCSVIVHANGSRAMFYAGLAGWLAGRPVIWHVRVADRDSPLDRFLFRLASVVVVNSQAVASRFSWAQPGQVRCIYNGVDLTRFYPRAPSPEVRRALGIPDGTPVVTSVGRFVSYKGYEYLLEAARLVCDVRPEVHWVLAGEGELKGALIARAHTLGVENQVHFTGWREDTPELLALCDVFVLPSLGEHFGRVLIEAMGMAKAIVATDAGGVPEVVAHGETGLLVPPAQPKPLADAVLSLLADPARAARLGLAGRKRAEAQFSLDRHVRAVEALYGELLGGAGGHV
nr:glycosyltransferase family 4 protein [Nitrospirota bacterium]